MGTVKQVVEKNNATTVQAKKEKQVQAKTIESDDVESKEDLRSHIKVLKKENKKLKNQCHEYFDDVSKLKLKSKELIVHSDTQMKEGNSKVTELQTELKREKEKVTKLKVDGELLRDENEQLNEKNTDLKKRVWYFKKVEKPELIKLLNDRDKEIENLKRETDIFQNDCDEILLQQDDEEPEEITLDEGGDFQQNTNKFKPSKQKNNKETKVHEEITLDEDDTNPEIQQVTDKIEVLPNPTKHIDEITLENGIAKISIEETSNKHVNEKENKNTENQGKRKRETSVDQETITETKRQKPLEAKKSEDLIDNFIKGLSEKLSQKEKYNETQDGQRSSLNEIKSDLIQKTKRKRKLYNSFKDDFMDECGEIQNVEKRTKQGPTLLTELAENERSRDFDTDLVNKVEYENVHEKHTQGEGVGKFSFLIEQE